MKTYSGTMSVDARPMTRAEYNELRGWELPADENGDDLGMYVEYPNTGHKNWMTRDIFGLTFKEKDRFSFSEALIHVKAGKRVAREGWNGKNMFIFLVPGSTFQVNREPLMSILGEGTEVNYHGHVDMRTADGMIVPWLCSQTDMLANDWGIVPDA